MVYAHNITLDEEAEQILRHRADAECSGNLSRAARSFIVGSVDSGIRYRRQLQPHVDALIRKLGMRKRQRTDRNGFIIEELDQAIRQIEETIASVSTG